VWSVTERSLELGCDVVLDWGFGHGRDKIN